MMRWWHRLSLAWLYAALACAYMLAAGALGMLLTRWLPPWAATLVAAALLAPFLIYQVHRLFAPVRSLFRALAGTVDSYRDGDFSFGLSWQGSEELRELVRTHNALGDALREQRLGLVQRELLLDMLGDPGAQQYPQVARRIRAGGDALALWYARADLMAALAGLHGEQVARTRMVSLSVLFEGTLPKGMMSRPTTLRT